MSRQSHDGFGALTEKEKQTLRLIVRGHDAKSIARSLDLSVHTINERLRDARRKIGVSSSREAARLLFRAEGGDHASAPSFDPHLFGDAKIGADGDAPAVDQETAPISGVWRAQRRPRIIIGVSVMTIFLGLLALAATTQPVASPSPTSATETAQASEVVLFAQQWLTLLDQGRWEDSYQATSPTFRKQNTVKVWASASEQARTPLGPMISRTLLSQENLPAPPAGYEVVKFRTRFANKTEAVETVALDRVDGHWRVVGVTIG